MSFPINQLPESFQEDHGSNDVDEKPLTPQDDDERDEVLTMDGVDQRVWLVKIPKFLMERWSQVEEEGVELGRVRVYDEKDVNGDPKIAVLLPAEPAPTPASNGLLPATDRKGKGRTSIIRRPTAVPTEYKLTLQNTATKNMFVFGEKEEDVKDTGVEGARKRRRITKMLGTIHHECALTPSLSSKEANSSYRDIMRNRQKLAAEPKRTLKMLDVDKGTAAKLASGIGLRGIKAKAISFVQTKKTKGINQRAERMPLNELYDLLFTHFSQSTYWSLKALKEHINQPEVYLRQTLNEIGNLIKAGPYIGMWALKETYKGVGGRQKADAGAPTTSSVAGKEGEESGVVVQGEVKLELAQADMADQGDEEDDDDDMELVA